jgi:hypothetical protein
MEYEAAIYYETLLDTVSPSCQCITQAHRLELMDGPVNDPEPVDTPKDE